MFEHAALSKIADVVRFEPINASYELGLRLQRVEATKVKMSSGVSNSHMGFIVVASSQLRCRLS